MQNKVYFTEAKPGVYKRDSKFKLKTDFVANNTKKLMRLVGKFVKE